MIGERVVRIERRFAGPPQSANGGYACGLVAEGLPGPVEVTLHAPPPLERDLEVREVEGETHLLDDGGLVARARPVHRRLEAPAAPSYDDALAAAASFDVERYAAAHAYPACFSCGPRREPGDGLRIHPAAVAPDRTAWPWTPDPSLADEDDTLPAPVVWAALDCPSGLSALVAGRSAGPIVLGRMTLQQHRPVRPGEPLVVGGWAGEVEGRKLHCGSAAWTAEGEVLAVSAATWLVLTEEQQRAFGAAGSA